MENHRLRHTVGQNISHLLRRRMPVRRHQNGSGPGDGAHDFKMSEVVAHDDGDPVVRLNPKRRQRRAALRRTRLKIGAADAPVRIGN